MQTADKKLLILDLDETLIFATEEKLNREADFIVGQYYVYQRPHLVEFLEFCFRHFDIAVWTTATKSYAEEILRKILNDSQNLQFLWTREKCTFSYDADEQEHYLVKKMHKVRRRRYLLESVIVVDDSPNVWKSSYGNLVCVKRFEGEENDDELKLLPFYLKQLLSVSDVRAIEKRNWRNRL